MKRIICLLWIAVFILTLTACSDSKGETSSAASSEATSQASSASDPTTVVTDNNTSDGTKANSKSDPPKTDGVDVDLSKMSATMVYSEVLNMQQHPDDYMGKIIRMKGPFSVTEIDGNRYYACVVKDAAACCSTGIEFVRAGDYTYPDDYPEKDEEITVTGAFNIYSEGESKYLQLTDAELEF